MSKIYPVIPRIVKRPRLLPWGNRCITLFHGACSGNRGEAVAIKLVLALVLILAGFSAPVHAMTLMQLRELKGFDLISSRVDAILTDYGMPAAIIDHGTMAQKTSKDAKWGAYTLNLTDDDWTLVYSGESREATGPGRWINPEPSMPAKFSGLKALSLLTYGNARGVIQKDRRSNRMIPGLPANVFQTHHVYQVTAVLPAGSSSEKIVEKYGKEYEGTTNAGRQHVLRYWVKGYRTRRVPPNLYAVDFELKEDGSVDTYTITGVRVDEATEKLNRMIDRFNRGCQEDSEDGSRCLGI